MAEKQLKDNKKPDKKRVRKPAKKKAPAPKVIVPAKRNVVDAISSLFAGAKKDIKEPKKKEPEKLPKKKPEIPAAEEPKKSTVKLPKNLAAKKEVIEKLQSQISDDVLDEKHLLTLDWSKPEIDLLLKRFYDLGKTHNYINEDNLLMTFVEGGATARDVQKAIYMLKKDGIFIKQTSEDDREKEDIIEKIMSDASIDDPVKIYLRDIGRHALLTGAEELETAKRMAEGESDEERMAARMKLNQCNLRLVVHIALQ